MFRYEVIKRAIACRLDLVKITDIRSFRNDNVLSIMILLCFVIFCGKAIKIITNPYRGIGRYSKELAHKYFAESRISLFRNLLFTITRNACCL